jgi:predicted dehydrogenase
MEAARRPSQRGEDVPTRGASKDHDPGRLSMTRPRNRRDFLAATGASAAGFGLFGILGGRSARAELAPRAALKTPVLGLIGAGGMGRANTGVFMDQKVPVACVCDVDSRHSGEAADEIEKKQGKRPDVVKDFRELLDRKDIDIVIIGTPDHWHAIPTVLACEAGKDLYLEKPISHDIHEARTMAAAAKKHQRIVQVGTWQRSTAEFVAALDYVRSGKLGRVVVARAWKTDNATVGKVRPQEPPDGLDYDFWVGPAEFVPYAENRCHYNWRWFWNTAAGMTGDWGVHMIDIALLGLGKGGDDVALPLEAVCQGGKLAYPDDDRTTPDTQLALLKYPNAVLQWETNRRPLDGEHDNGTQFIADDGKTVTVWRGGWSIKTADNKDVDRPSDPEGMDGLGAHVRNFLECVESREPPRSNIASMARTTIVCHLINASFLAKAPVRLDAETLDIQGDTGKDTISYRRDYRSPWTLPSYG